MILRPYQQRNLNEILACLQRGVKGTVYVCPTGGGKTLTAVNVIRTVVNNGWEAAFFVHRRELLKQASTTLRRHGIPHGLIAPGHDLTEHPVHVASVDTFRSRFKRLEPWLKTIKLVVIDEAHHAPAGGFKRILQSMASDACALGLTATPFRLDGKGLREFFSEQVKAPTIADLTSDGYLSPAHVHQPPLKISTAGIATRGGDFVQSDLAKRMDDDELTRATVANYARYAAGVPTIAFCAGVDHAKHVAERFTEAGWRAESVDGTLSTGERDRRIKALGTGELQILTSCDIISEGTDCLDLETEILTPNGWKKHDDVQEGDHVYSYNATRRIIEETEVDRVFTRETRPDENMLSIESQHTSIRVTEGHLLFYRKINPPRPDGLCDRIRWATARQLHDDKQPFAIPICGIADFPGVPLTDDELKFIAWFITDGFRQRYYIGISQAKEHHHSIRRIISDLGLDFIERKKPYGDSCYNKCSNGFIYEFLVPKGTGKIKRNGWSKYEKYLDKDISPYLDLMTARQFHVFWDEMMKGDGTRHGSDTKSGHLCTASLKMANRLSAMAVVRGRSCKVRYSKTPSGKPFYYINSSHRESFGRSNWFKFSPKDSRGARFKLEPANQGERVWCITTQNGTIITRRRGCVAILGNCPIVGGAILLRPTKSTGLFLQQIGRVLRPYQGKDAAIVIDMVGNVKTHGMPDANRVWSLHDGIDKTQREKIVERTRRCPKRGCWRVHEWAEKCPGCGYVYPANPLNNRAPGAPIYMPKNGLMGFTAEQIHAAKLSDLMRLKPNEQELKVIARVKGYKQGWVWFQLKQREEMKQRFRSRWR